MKSQNNDFNSYILTIYIISQICIIILPQIRLVFLIHVFEIKYCQTEVLEQPGGGTPSLNVMTIHDQRHANVSKQRTLLADADVAPHHGSAPITWLVNVFIEKWTATILSINGKLPLTRVHLTQEHIWIFLGRELPSVQLSFLWCTVLWIATTENGVRHTWTCQVVVVPESLSLACSIWWKNRNHFDGVFKEYLSGIHWHVCFWK